MPPNSWAPPSVWIDPIPIRKTRVSNRGCQTYNGIWWDRWRSHFFQGWGKMLAMTSTFTHVGHGWMTWLNPIQNDFWKSAASTSKGKSRKIHAWLVVQNQIYVLTFFWPLKLFLQHKIYWNNTSHPQMMGFWHWVYHIVSNDPSIIHQSSTIVRYTSIFNHWLTINSPLEPTLNHYESLLINY